MSLKTLAAFLFCALLITQSVKAQLVINEYSASNLYTYIDNFNEYEDWIEIYNPSSSAVNLNGYHLSDKSGNISKWTFGSVTISANGFVRVWASNKNITSGTNLHTNFTLKQCQGEKILLSNPSNVILDSLTLRRTQVGHSRGRTTNGATTWSVFTNPTPGTTNNTSTPFLGYATTPAMSLAPGFYSAAQVVTLSSPDPGITIKYTTTGATPSSSGVTYFTAIPINTTQVIRAQAFSSNPSVLNSFVASNTYFINTTHSVNVVSVFGDQINSLMAGSSGLEPEVGLEYFDHTGAFKTEGYGESNKHGNDSWAYAQRGIDFVCRDEFGYNDALKHQIFNSKTRNEYQRIMIKAAANDNYPFEGQANANFPGELGGAHIRDAYVHTVSQKAKMHLDERTWAPAILYINGKYWGVYDVREKVDDKDFTEYYYESKEDSLQFLQTWGSTWSAYGGTQAQTDWNNLKNFIVANSMTVASNYNYVDSLLSTKSLADYVILNSYVVCSDWLNWNTSWWRGLNYDCDKKKWRYTLWDEDATFKHYINYTAVPNLNVNANPCDPQSLGNPGSQGHIPIINKLLTNPTFKQYYVMRYFDLINSGLSCTRMTQILDSMILVIKPEMPAQIAKWGGTMTEWQNNVNALKTFIQQRCDTLTKLFNTCYNVTGPYKIKINVNPPNSGTVDFNSLNISSFVWQGTYPGNLPNNLKAHAKANYCFSHWTTKTHTLSPSMNDSIVSLLLSGNDSIVAHFIYNPKITATPVSSVICQGGTVQLSASNGVNYSWQPNTGLSCSTCSNPIVSPSSSTTYTVTSFNNPSCKTSATTTITVAANAVASFTAASTQTATLPQTITVTNTSSQASSFSWTFNNGTPTITPNPKFLVNTPGTYTISMIAFGSNNCNDTTSGIVIIHDTTKVYPIVPTVFMPNVFTPNNDGVNDAFHPVMKGFKEANCTIIDRWGVQVFELKEVNAVWYGENSNGNPCPAGTYFYIFNGVDLNNKDYTYKGFVQLIR